MATATEPSGFGPTGSDPLNACLNQYNGLILRAKKSLVQGDRNDAISFLLEAHTQLGRCRDIREHSPAAAVRLGSNQDGLSTAGLVTPCA